MSKYTKVKKRFFRFIERHLGEIVIIFLVLLTISFLTGEHLSLGKSINPEKVGAYATSLAAILTTVTVFLLYRQNLHLIDDRNAATQPDLFPDDISLYTINRNINVNDQVISTPFFFRKPYDPNGEPRDDDNFDVVVDIHNIGLGVAKSIMAFWKYDPEEIKSFIGIDNEEFENELDDKISTIKFLRVNSSGQIIMPSLYTRCLNFQLNLDFDEINIAETASPKLDLKLQLVCLNVYNKVVRKFYDINFVCNRNHIEIYFENGDADDWDNYETDLL